MAFSLHAFLVLSLLLGALHSHARELPAFNKISASDTTTISAAVGTGEGFKNRPEDVEQPTFVPETDKPYGIDGHIPTIPEEFSGDLNPHLPTNYNPVAYVTQPDGFKEPSFPDKETYYTVDASEDIDENPSKYGYNEEEHGTNFNYNGDFDEPESLATESEEGHGTNSYYNERHRYDFNYNSGSGNPTSLIGGSVLVGGDSMPQGMSDTRALENGKYFYDLGAEKFNINHPYEEMKQGFDENRYSPSDRRNYGQNSLSGGREGYSNFWP